MLIWASLKNYLHSLRYVFTILGMILLFLVAAISFTVRKTVPVVETAATEIKGVVSNVDVSAKEITDAAQGAMDDLTHAGIFEAIDKITNPQWFIDTMATALGQLFDRFVGYAVQIGEIIGTAIGQFIQILKIAAIIFVAGPVLGYILVMYFIRSDVEKKNIFRIILGALIDCIVMAASAALLFWIGTKVNINPIILLAIFPALSGYLLLVVAYLYNGCKKKGIKFAKITRFYNILFLYIASILELALTAVICLLIYLLTQSIAVTGVLALGLVMVCIVALSLNATAYVNMFIEKKEKQENKEAREEVAKMEAEKAEAEKLEEAKPETEVIEASPEAAPQTIEAKPEPAPVATEAKPEATTTEA